MPVKPIPDGYHSVTPYLVMKNAAGALEFYKKAFGAVEMFKMPMPGGKLAHAEIRIGDSIVMFADEPETGTRGPESLGGTTVGLCLYVEDVDRVTHQAVSAGAKILRPLEDQFYGDRTATITDPFGHMWTIMTHKEDVSPEEMSRRMQKQAKA